MRYKPDHKRIKIKYNPKPTAREKAYHLSVMSLPCMGCCVTPAGVAHHPLMRSPLQRWRRDHEFVVPVCHDCHVDIHTFYGNERIWADAMGATLPMVYAEELREKAISEGGL